MSTTRTEPLDLHAPFPVEWNAWRAQWAAYLAARDLPASSHRFPGVNFLADEVLGTFDTPTGPAELSEVTFPDLSGRRHGRRVRYVGVTLATGPDAAGGIVSTFAELDRMLGIDDEPEPPATHRRRYADAGDVPTPVDLPAETIRRHAREYADGVAVLYGGDHADPDTVAGELRAQASELDSFRAQLDRDPTDDERDAWHDELVRIAERIEDTGEVNA